MRLSLLVASSLVWLGCGHPASRDECDARVAEILSLLTSV